MFRKTWSYISLYGAHGLKAFSFVLLIPHFTQIFPKNVWATVLTVQAFSLWLQIIVEYGFNLSATRRMSQVRDDVDELARLVSSIVGAKIVLSIIVSLIAIFSAYSVTSLHDAGTLLLWGVIFSIAQGFNPTWYFLAREKFGQYAALDFMSRLIYLLLCYSFIKDGNQSYLVFGFGIITFTFSSIVGYSIISKDIHLKLPDLTGTIDAMRDGFSMFLFFGITSVYTTLNIVILGFYQPPSIVAGYGTSDRVVRSAGGLLDPLNRVVFSKLSYLYHHDPASALLFLRKAAIGIVSISFVIFIGGELFTDKIISVLMPDYPEAKKYLTVLFFYIPVLALNNIVGLHIMIPMQLDKEFNTVFILASAMSVLVMLLTIPRYGAIGLAYTTIFTESLVILGMCIVTWKSGKIQSIAQRKSYA